MSDAKCPRCEKEFTMYYPDTGSDEKMYLAYTNHLLEHILSEMPQSKPYNVAYAIAEEERNKTPSNIARSRARAGEVW